MGATRKARLMATDRAAIWAWLRLAGWMVFTDVAWGLSDPVWAGVTGWLLLLAAMPVTFVAAWQRRAAARVDGPPWGVCRCDGR